MIGRSKEVINRGGEIISPFDIEDVVMTHPSVKATVAFSVPHDKLQETIGVVIVTKKGALVVLGCWELLIGVVDWSCWELVAGLVGWVVGC